MRPARLLDPPVQAAAVSRPDQLDRGVLQRIRRQQEVVGPRSRNTAVAYATRIDGRRSAMRLTPKSLKDSAMSQTFSGGLVLS